MSFNNTGMATSTSSFVAGTNTGQFVVDQAITTQGSTYSYDANPMLPAGLGGESLQVVDQLLHYTSLPNNELQVDDSYLLSPDGGGTTASVDVTVLFAPDHLTVVAEHVAVDTDSVASHASSASSDLQAGDPAPEPSPVQSASATVAEGVMGRQQ